MRFIQAKPNKEHRELRQYEKWPTSQPGSNLQEIIWRRYEGTTNRLLISQEEMWVIVQETTQYWAPTKIKRLCNVS
jgi:hypothetical protein